MIDRKIHPPKDHSFFLFGPRQTGKSTLLRSIFPRSSTLYIDLLKSSEFLRYASNPSLFRQDIDHRPSSVSHVIIDEIQRLPILLDEVHSIMENENAPFFGLSGSSARKLKRANANMLGGRAWTLDLFPLTHQELGPSFSLDRALALGTLPIVVISSSPQHARKTLRSYVQTYLKEEILAESLVRTAGAFHRFLPLAANANGTILNYSSISREVGVSYNTVKDYFSILEDTLLGFFLPPFSGSLQKRLTRHPKFYLFDPGVQRAAIGKAGIEIQRKTIEFGSAFEHWVILECVRNSSYYELDFTFTYFRTSNHAEVDLIVERPGKSPLAVEIKATDRPHPGSLSGLRSFTSLVSDAIPICACLAPRPSHAGSVRILPWKNLIEEYFTVN